MANTRKSHKSKRAAAPTTKGPEAASVLAKTTPKDTALATTPAAAPPIEPTTIPTEAPPEKQTWYRPAGGGTHKKFLKIAVMREAGRKTDDIAKRLKTTEAMVRQIEYLAKKNGWADADGEPVDIEAELAFNIDRKIVRNISAALDGGMTNYQTHEMTLAAAKGRGMFKAQTESSGQPAVNMPVAIQIIMPAIGASDQTIVEANVGGTPAYVEGEVDGQLQLGRAGDDAEEGAAETRGH